MRLVALNTLSLFCILSVLIMICCGDLSWACLFGGFCAQICMGFFPLFGEDLVEYLVCAVDFWDSSPSYSYNSKGWDSCDVYFLFAPVSEILLLLLLNFNVLHFSLSTLPQCLYFPIGFCSGPGPGVA